MKKNLSTVLGIIVLLLLIAAMWIGGGQKAAPPAAHPANGIMPSGPHAAVPATPDAAAQPAMPAPATAGDMDKAAAAVQNAAQQNGLAPAAGSDTPPQPAPDASMDR